MDLQPLLRPVYDNPWDLGVRSVVADRLVELGHPYGEFIHASIRAEALPQGAERRELERHAEGLRRAHESEWLRPIGRNAENVEYRGGFPWRADIDLDGLWRVENAPTWRTLGQCSLRGPPMSWDDAHCYAWAGTKERFLTSDTTAETLEEVDTWLPIEVYRRLAAGRTLALSRVGLCGSEDELLQAVASPRPGLPMLEHLALCRAGFEPWAHASVTALRREAIAAHLRVEFDGTFGADTLLAVTLRDRVAATIRYSPVCTVHLDGLGGATVEFRPDEPRGSTYLLHDVLRSELTTHCIVRVGAFSVTAHGQEEIDEAFRLAASIRVSEPEARPASSSAPSAAP